MSLRIVAGLSLKGIRPRVWDSRSAYHLPNLSAVMVSYADFIRMPAKRRRAMEQGIHAYLGIPDTVSVYLDNGSFYFMRNRGEVDWESYQSFVEAARPDWYPVPQDFIPTPRMSDAEQRRCLERTMSVNLAHLSDGYVPVIHISRYLGEYLQKLQDEVALTNKPWIALGGIVPNLLRAPKAMSYTDVLERLNQVRSDLDNTRLHVFGIGGTATLHLAAIMGIDSVDSSGWRNRAARGIVQLPGRGDRVVAELGKWRGRRPDNTEWDTLAACQCPACKKYGLDGLKANRLFGFCNRATHNLSVLIEEARLIRHHLASGDYEDWFVDHVENSIYLSLIQKAMTLVST